MNERFFEKFIMTEFVKGHLNTQTAVNDMLLLIEKKLHKDKMEAAAFLRAVIGLA
ncbi:hypothetical protein [Palleniella muris]|uniref:hypothetical protein n=1 Tax=Palleniella muris TaxID=3038145 RepID=UPI0014410172|nr:hypothetical protein [Palleniella muris]